MSLWHELVARDPIPPGDFLDRMARSGALHGGQPACVHRRPHFISARAATSIRESTRQIHKALRALLAALVGDGLDGRDGSLARLLGLSPEIISLAAIEPGAEEEPTLLRVRVALHQDHPMLLDIDAEGDVPLGYSDVLTSFFEQDPFTVNFPGLMPFRGGEELAQAVLRTWSRWSGSAGGAPKVAIVGFRDDPRAVESTLLQRRFQLQGVRCVVADPRELSFQRGRLIAEGQAIDVVHRRVHIESFISRPDDCKALLDAVRGGAVCMVNSLRAGILHSRALLAYLHDMSFLAGLPEAQRDAIRHHVPWTGLLCAEPGAPRSDQLVFLANAHRNELALRPLSSELGRSIPGWMVTQDDWEEMLEEANHHVLQRRVPIERHLFPDARAGYKLTERLVELSVSVVRGRATTMLAHLREGPKSPDSTLAPVFAVPAP